MQEQSDMPTKRNQKRKRNLERNTRDTFEIISFDKYIECLLNKPTKENCNKNNVIRNYKHVLNLQGLGEKLCVFGVRRKFINAIESEPWK